jgi:predicted ester cyclase
MIRLAAVAVVLVGGCYGGCSKKKESEAIEPPPVAAAEPEAPAKLTGADLAKRYDTCWGYFDASDWDKFKPCWTADVTFGAPGNGSDMTGADKMVDAAKQFKAGFPDMKGEPELELVHGHDVVAVSLMTGTHTGPVEGVSAMNQKIGVVMGQVLAFDDQGRLTHDNDYLDEGTLMGQLAPSKDHPVRPAQDKLAAAKQVVIAKDDAAEQANVAVVKQAVDAFNKHDAKSYAALLADDSVWSEQEEPKDWNKAETMADHEQGWKAFSDLKLDPTTMWAAGDYVVAIGALDGTNDGPLPMMAKPTKKHVSLPFLTIHEIESGKIAKTWVFAQGMAFMQQLGLLPATK